MAINKESVEIINSKFFKKQKSLLANNANMHYLLLFKKCIIVQILQVL